MQVPISIPGIWTKLVSWYTWDYHWNIVSWIIHFKRFSTRLNFCWFLLYCKTYFHLKVHSFCPLRQVEQSSSNVGQSSKRIHTSPTLQNKYFFELIFTSKKLSFNSRDFKGSIWMISWLLTVFKSSIKPLFNFEYILFQIIFFQIYLSSTNKAVSLVSEFF